MMDVFLYGVLVGVVAGFLLGWIARNAMGRANNNLRREALLHDRRRERDYHGVNL